MLEKNIFENNSAEYDGGAIYFGGENGSLVLNSNKFIKNKAVRGGAIFWSISPVKLEYNN